MTAKAHTNTLKPNFSLDGLPLHTRQKIQAHRDSKAQWIDACRILNAIGGLEVDEARTVWREQLDQLKKTRGPKWASEVNQKAALEIKKEGGK